MTPDSFCECGYKAARGKDCKFCIRPKNMTTELKKKNNAAEERAWNKLRERVFFDGWIHELLLKKRMRKASSPISVFLKKPNKHYKRILIIES